MQQSWSRSLWVDFGEPLWLLLLPPIWLACWWFSRSRVMVGSTGRGILLLATRAVVVGLLVGALAEPTFVRRAKHVTAVVVRDVSQSVPMQSQRILDAYLAASLPRRQQNDRFGIVTTARDAYVQSLPSARALRSESGFVGDQAATDLAAGLSLAEALATSDTGTRVVLASDGNQSRGNVLAAARKLAARGIPVDVIPLAPVARPRVVVEEVMSPSWARPGTMLNVRVVLNAERAITGRLTLTANGEAIDLSSESSLVSTAVELHEGLNVLSIPYEVSDRAVERFGVFFEPDEMVVGEDPRVMRGESLTFVETKGRILAVVREDEPVPVLSALRSGDVAMEMTHASQCPAKLEELVGYDAVVLVNQAAFEFTQAQQEALRSYVHDGGGGLLLLGGPDSFGAGGWIGSPLEDALPVSLDPPQKRQMPMGGLAIIIDRSGSMSGMVGDSSLDQQTVANESAILGVKALSRLDRVAIIAFDDTSEVIVPLTPCSDVEGIARRVRSIGPGGGTNLFPALDAAASELGRMPGGVKHVIVLTDGQTTGDPADGIAKVKELKRKGITLSTVAIGDYSNDGLLRQLALVGGGRSYQVNTKNSQAILPQIFVKEAQTVRRSLIWEGPGFVPRVTYAAGSLLGVSGPLPSIEGYVVTADRGGLSTVMLRGPEGDPILAEWQYGLGRVVIYASDAGTRWNKSWIGWGGYSAFWKQQLQWAMRPIGDANARLTMVGDGDSARVQLELLGLDQERVNFASVVGSAVGPDGRSVDVEFRQVGPGLYQGEFGAEQTGVHMMSLRYEAPSEGGTRSGAIRGAYVRKAGEELRVVSEDSALLRSVAEETGGRVLRADLFGTDLWTREGLRMPVRREAVWHMFALAAIGLFLFDVGVRRVAIDREIFLAGFATFMKRTKEAPRENKLHALSAVRERARLDLEARSRVMERVNAEVRKLDHGDVGEVATPPRIAPLSDSNRVKSGGTPDETLSRLRGIKTRLHGDEGKS